MALCAHATRRSRCSVTIGLNSSGRTEAPIKQTPLTPDSARATGISFAAQFFLNSFFLSHQESPNFPCPFRAEFSLLSMGAELSTDRNGNDPTPVNKICKNRL